KDIYPDATIVRPSVVFGPEDDFFNRFGAMAQLFPALPLIGGGHTKFQPVFAGDVAQTLLAAIEGRTKTDGPYELGGPEILTMRDVMERVLAYTMRSRALIPLPFWLAKLQGAILQWLPNPPLTTDQVRLLEKDNVVGDEAIADGRTLDGLGIKPEAVADIVPGYLEQYRPRGQFSVYKGNGAAPSNGH
ncbi:MAG: complex I NDUFA9 subunit family protein, partial [Pseudomonadota bacterium]